MKFKTLREYENAHIVLWIIKDTSWCLGLRWLGMMMILPTILVALDITYRSREDVIESSHNIAVCCWITANAIWMTGEFFFNDTLRPVSLIFFVIGIISLAFHYIPELWGRIG